MRESVEAKEVVCRYCRKSSPLEVILDLGLHPLSGVFPKTNDSDPISGPLRLVLCLDCQLVQLSHDFPLEMMYGENYGYESSLNGSMREHLVRKANFLQNKYLIGQKEVNVLDIGANDGTFIKEFLGNGHNCVAIDPTLVKLHARYEKTEKLKLIEGFFPSALEQTQINLKFKIITSIAMFYDLPNPDEFVKSIALHLDKDGIWHTEQSYLYSMLDTNAFDTICHEHLEYYTFDFIEKLCKHNKLRIIDVSINKINGGSFALTIAHEDSDHSVSPNVRWLRDYEEGRNLRSELVQFADRVEKIKDNLHQLIDSIKKSGKVVWALGASTKGNTLLTYCDLDQNMIDAVVDINPYKYGRETPGTRIPIYSEDEFAKANPDYLLVLPWHFDASITVRHTDYIEHGGTLIFPMPQILLIAD